MQVTIQNVRLGFDLDPTVFSDEFQGSSFSLDHCLRVVCMW